MPGHSGAAVLVVEDEPDIRETYRDVLETEGYCVLCASNGKEALAALAEGPRPGLILLDLMMPEMNGYDLLKVLRADRALASIPVTVVSAAGDRTSVSGAPVLRKPVDIDTLLHVVDERCR